MPTAAIEPIFLYGVKANVYGGVYFTSDDKLLYPAGCGASLYCSQTKHQTFIPLADQGKSISAICISDNKKYIAFAERGPRPFVMIYDLEARKKRKVIQCAEVKSEEVISLAFSHDSKYLLAQGGEPDYLLVYFFWEKSKVVTTSKMSNEFGSPVVQVSFHPKDNSVVCVVGKRIFKMCRLTEGVLKAFGFQKGEQYNVMCQDWILDRLLIGTDKGKILMFLNAEHLSTLEVDLRRAGDEETRYLDEADSDNCVSAIVTYSKGFYCSCGLGRVFQFEKNDEEELSDKISFSQTRVFFLPEVSTSLDPANSWKKMITSLAINFKENLLVALTDDLQLYSACVKLSEIKRQTSLKFSIFSHSFHNGEIYDVDVCRRKPLAITCGADKTVRVWNYKTLQLELMKEFQEDIYCVALHSSGLYLAAGFADKLRLMNILIDDIRTYREYPVRASVECVFSNGGHLLAAVNGINIQILSTISFEKINEFKGHNGTVTSITWSEDDLKLVSCAEDGSIYEWEVSTGKRIQESVVKTCSYTFITLSPDGKDIYAVGTDKTLKHISNSEIIKEVDLHNITLSTIGLSHCGRMLFSGTDKGRVASFKFPLVLPADFREKRMHGANVSQLKVTYDDQCLITSGEDGSMCFWKITDEEGRVPEIYDKEFAFAEEILITKSELEEKNKIIQDLKLRVDELKTENAYQLRKKENQNSDIIRDMQSKYNVEIGNYKQQIKRMQQELDSNKNAFNDSLDQLKMKNNDDLIRQEEIGNAKLVVEYNKFDKLTKDFDNTCKDYEKKIVCINEENAENVNKITKEFEERIEANEKILKQKETEATEKVSEIEEMLRQTEEDADKEILELRVKFEKQLRAEKESNIRFRGESGIMKKKLDGVQKEIDDYKSSIESLKNTQQKLTGTIKNLEKDISDLKKEIRERDGTIGEKEKLIGEQKRKINELQKYKFILDHKIHELNQQIVPKDEKIDLMRDQIQEMEEELQAVTKNQNNLEMLVKEKKIKLNSSIQELVNEKRKYRGLQSTYYGVQKDIHALLGLLQDPNALKESVKDLHNKCGSIDEVMKEKVDEKKIIEETNKHRDFLEKTVTSLKKKIEKDEHTHKQGIQKMIRQNTELMEEITRLRKEISLQKKKVSTPKMLRKKNSN